MRIFILLNGRFPTQKAYGLQVQTMARGFAEAGIPVAVAYPRRTRQLPPDLSGIVYVPYGPYLPLVHGLLFHVYRWFGLIGLSKALKSYKPDIVLANDPIQAAFLPKPWKVIWDLHDMPDPRLASRRRLIRRILSRASGVLSTNQRKLDRLKDMGYKLPPTIVLPNPVTFEPSFYRSINREEARRDLGVSETERAIVYAGQLYDWKGVDTLIKSAEYLREPYRIHIVGGLGADLERCRSLAQSLPLGSAQVVFHGQRPAEEIPAWLRAATIVVIPNSGKYRLSVEDTNPLKAYEALAAEAAIVASDLPAIHDALGEAAKYFKADDPVDLAKAIEALGSDPGKLSRARKTASDVPLLTARERAERLIEFLHL